MKITINIEYPEQSGFANVEVLFPSGNKYSVNGYKVYQSREKRLKYYVFSMTTKSAL